MKRNFILTLLLIVNLCFGQAGNLMAQQSDVQKQVNDYMDAHVKMNQFSGSILIAKNGHILMSRGYGSANYEFNIENTPQTKFRIGSLTKGFTAVAIMQLVENNILSLDDNS